VANGCRAEPIVEQRPALVDLVQDSRRLLAVALESSIALRQPFELGPPAGAVEEADAAVSRHVPAAAFGRGWLRHKPACVGHPRATKIERRAERVGLDELNGFLHGCHRPVEVGLAGKRGRHEAGHG
jgi:hypothetical protein